MCDTMAEIAPLIITCEVTY